MLNKIDKTLAVGVMVSVVLGLGYLGGRAFKDTPWYIFPVLAIGGLGLVRSHQGNTNKSSVDDIANRIRRNDWRNGN